MLWECMHDTDSIQAKIKNIQLNLLLHFRPQELIQNGSKPTYILINSRMHNQTQNPPHNSCLRHNSSLDCNYLHGLISDGTVNTRKFTSLFLQNRRHCFIYCYSGLKTCHNKVWAVWIARTLCMRQIRQASIITVIQVLWEIICHSPQTYLMVLIS